MEPRALLMMGKDPTTSCISSYNVLQYFEKVSNRDSMWSSMSKTGRGDKKKAQRSSDTARAVLKRWSRGWNHRVRGLYTLLVLAPCSLQSQKTAAESGCTGFPPPSVYQFLAQRGTPEEASFSSSLHFWLLKVFPSLAGSLFLPS